MTALHRIAAALERIADAQERLAKVAEFVPDFIPAQIGDIHIAGEPREELFGKYWQGVRDQQQGGVR